MGLSLESGVDRVLYRSLFITAHHKIVFLWKTTCCFKGYSIIANDRIGHYVFVGLNAGSQLTGTG